MRIALFFTYGYSLKSWKISGILDKELEIYIELNKQYDLSFIFITYGDTEDIDLVAKYKFIEVIPLGQYIKLSNSKVMNYIKSFFIPFKIKKLIYDVDLIKQHQLLGSWVSVGCKYLINKPLIVRTGYDMFLFSIKEEKSSIIKMLYFLLTFFTIKNANLYTLSSNSDYKKLKKYFSLNKISIRQNWIKEIPEPKPLDLRHSKKILAVGRLEAQKNYTAMINALQGGDFTLDIVGEGSLKDSIKNLATEKGVSINFLGNYENHELLKIYQDYKYFLQTSLYEGNPKSILEAMSSGCIVIASDIENNQEIIGNNLNGVLFSDDEDILSCIHRLEKDFELSKSISMEATGFIEKNYLIANLVKKEYSDYRKLIR